MCSVIGEVSHIAGSEEHDWSPPNHGTNTDPNDADPKDPEPLRKRRKLEDQERIEALQEQLRKLQNEREIAEVKRQEGAKVTDLKQQVALLELEKAQIQELSELQVH